MSGPMHKIVMGCITGMKFRLLRPHKLRAMFVGL